MLFATTDRHPIFKISPRIIVGSFFNYPAQTIRIIMLGWSSDQPHGLFPQVLLDLATVTEGELVRRDDHVPPIGRWGWWELAGEEANFGLLGGCWKNLGWMNKGNWWRLKLGLQRHMLEAGNSTWDQGGACCRIELGNVANMLHLFLLRLDGFLGWIHVRRAVIGAVIGAWGGVIGAELLVVDVGFGTPLYSQDDKFWMMVSFLCSFF
jgi:hypothetical protein